LLRVYGFRVFYLPSSFNGVEEAAAAAGRIRQASIQKPKLSQAEVMRFNNNWLPNIDEHFSALVRWRVGYICHCVCMLQTKKNKSPP